MSKLRDGLIFLAGAEFFHTLSHILLPFFFDLPFDMGFTITHTFNVIAVIVNGLITVGLLLWAKRLK